MARAAAASWPLCGWGRVRGRESGKGDRGLCLPDASSEWGDREPGATPPGCPVEMNELSRVVCW